MSSKGIQMKLTHILAILLLAGLLVTACSPATETPVVEPEVESPAETEESQPAQNDEQAYPAVEFPEPTASDTYPAPVEFQEYDPYPESSPEALAARFMLDKPIYAGATTVSGSGPAGVPIFILDITFAGEPLAQGVIGRDGSFSFPVNELEKGHRLGIALGDLAGSGYTEEELLVPGYFGDTALTVPTIGFFLDTALVVER